MEGRPSPLTFEESQEGWIAGQTIAFMRDCAEASRPFIAHASLPRPHQCTAPSEPFWSMYEGMDLTLPPNADESLEEKAPHLKQMAAHARTGNWALFEPKTFEAARLRKLRGYLGAVSQVDHAVGLMLDFLREGGLAENTIVVYAADHGDYACEHGIMEKAPGICHDAITRVPFIWWAPGRLAAGHVAPEIVESVDVSATLCALADLPALETSDGKDLSPLLRGEHAEMHRVGVTEFAWSKSIRKGNFRLVYYTPDYFPDEYPNGFGELYDLDADPWEMTNLFFDPAYAEVVHDLRKEMLDWLVTTTRPVTVHAGARPPTRRAQCAISTG
ncbi:MAG: Arylsulfatase [bacterium ADurb.Bin429]|nr:MAG: Arylsulfatase [bacterium ADurb.Bin429]